MQIVEGIPEYLYHYTSLKSAKLILMNKTLRLTSLDNKLNDKKRDFAVLKEI